MTPTDLDPATLRWMVRSLTARASFAKRLSARQGSLARRDVLLVTHGALLGEADRIDRLVTRIERKRRKA